MFQLGLILLLSAHPLGLIKCALARSTSCKESKNLIDQIDPQ